MRPAVVQRDVVVIGGGILGLLVALGLAEKGFQVTVFVAPWPDPRTDSQRNHAWLQSGLLYVGVGLDAARVMYYAGLEMLDYLGFPPPKEPGLFRFSTDGEVDRFLRHAHDIGLANKVRHITDEIAVQRKLGPFYEQGCSHFEVPDSPFPEGALMEAARDQARHLGVAFRAELVRFARDDLARSGYVLRTSRETIDPRYAIVCAGAGTPRLMRDLGLSHSLQVNQSALLVFERSDGLQVPLFSDRSRGFTVVRWASSEVPPHGCVVLGGTDREPIRPGDESGQRSIPRAVEEKLLEFAPANWRGPNRQHRVTAGRKTDVLIQGRPTVEPWIYRCVEYPGLLFATPGKATLALDTAQRVIRYVGTASKSPSSTGDGTTSLPLPGEDWNDPIQQHNSPDHRDLDESEEA